MGRCQSCGKEASGELCGSCRYAKEREARRAAAGEVARGHGGRPRVAPPKPADPPDVGELRERQRRIEDALSEAPLE